jgi:dipeptidyl aminopeptidase/acylaminoacyl peptidase
MSHSHWNHRVLGAALLVMSAAAPVLGQQTRPTPPANPPASSVAAGSQTFGSMPATVAHANWTLAQRFSPEGLRNAGFGGAAGAVGPNLTAYSNAVQPHFLGKTDSMWYNWRDHTGSHFLLVIPALKAKKPLFDQAKLASQLSTIGHHYYNSNELPFATVTFLKDHKGFRFTADSNRYEYTLATETLKSLGRPARGGQPPADEEIEEGGGGRGGRGGGGRGGAFGGGRAGEFRNFSPDSTRFVFAMNHNLYEVEVGKTDTVQLTTDGVKNYSFGFRDTAAVQQQDDQQQQQDDQQQQGGGNNRDPRVRANVGWSPDSKAFSVQRTDQRKVKELYLVNVLAEPRPTLMSYTYSMPGEENVGVQEMYFWKVGQKTLSPLSVKKWKDQRLFYTHWNLGSDKLRIVRRDRLQRHAELLEIDLATGTSKVLVTEAVENGQLDIEEPHYFKRGGDFIWKSERSGWGQYYQYGNDGTYRRPFTQGEWRADAVVQMDTIAGTAWIAGYGREAGENVYYRHTYRGTQDGLSFALVDAGNFTHTPTLSPTKRFFVDNYSRVEAPTKAVLRDDAGRVVMELEETDVSKLRELGWRPPEQFMVKAADGVTDIYGNMWKPFDFDSTKKYPIIANVYPGPQTESVGTGFNGGGLPQQLAQLGFIVIQIGNRGGSPLRSAAYHNYGYFNLRDYALADKKAGIEQLAAKHPWIDIDRVGIYGHSGGGFLTGAAMTLPPYNEFFKVGWSESGNHDNNIYNANWSESNHGLKVVLPGQDSTQRGRRVAAGSRSDPSAADSVPPDSVKFQIHVPTNPELAANLKGNLMLVTGDMDNNVHPGNTIRMANALIKANKRFDFIILPGKPHGYGDYTPYNNQRMLEYFAEHLLGDYYQTGSSFNH